MVKSEWGLTALALILALLDQLEHKKILSEKEGQDIVLQAEKLLDILIKSSLPTGKGHGVESLRKIYAEALKNAGKQGPSNS